MDYIKERDEAIRAGESALNSLRKAKDQLDSARGWGIYDMLGGGIISSVIKRNRMNDASTSLREAQYALERFQKELGDLNLSFVATEISSGDFLSFADWFFDGLLVDVMMQERINRARAEVDSMIRRVGDLVVRLRNS